MKASAEKVVCTCRSPKRICLARGVGSETGECLPLLHGARCDLGRGERLAHDGSAVLQVALARGEQDEGQGQSARTKERHRNPPHPRYERQPVSVRIGSSLKRSALRA
jgi:hypothetical protein